MVGEIMRPVTFFILVLFILGTSFASEEYEIDSNYESTNCEFYIDSFYLESKSHYGIPDVSMVTNFKVNKQWGKLLRIGQWVKFEEKSNNKKNEMFVFGDYDRSIEFLIKKTREMDREILEFAYFIDIERPEGEKVRLWQSNERSNFTRII